MPQDPILLLSLVNTWLRDQYADPRSLCEDREWDYDELSRRLTSVGYTYQPELNQFR